MKKILIKNEWIYIMNEGKLEERLENSELINPCL